jgi:DNA-binding HxlR family transcriptional regulator
MERDNHHASNCSIARALGVLGERWTLLIIREGFYGATRFEQFHRVLKCPRNLLSERLTMLVEQGVLTRSEYQDPGRRARRDYHLTDKGRELAPILLALMQWGDRHLADPEGPATLIRHDTCAEEVRIAVTCSGGHGQVGVDALRFLPGPGALWPVPAGQDEACTSSLN